jgi:8-oxo-dGTP pyrophosphatase MutT (NUDIX family)
VSDEIRRAASVIAVREGVGAPEVLVVERSAQSRFLPSYVVFPGGAVDSDDEALAGRWFGEAGEAPRAAAVRELAEEAGLVLTGVGLRAASGEDPLVPAHDAPPSREQLHDLAHWIAPEDVPVRFDARYFAVAAPGGLDPVPDGHEAARAWWTSPAELLAGWEAGACKLYWPTLHTVRQLAACASAAELMALHIETREPDDDEERGLPRSVFWQD